MTVKDKLLFAIGTISAICAGLILPSIAIVVASVASLFTDSADRQNVSVPNMSFIASVIVVVACSLFTFAYMFFAFWQ